MQTSIKKRVDAEWAWIADYGYMWADWTINVQEGRRCEVGTGISIRGIPRGAIRQINGYLELKTYGIGAIHIRVTDGRGPCNVQVDEGKVGLITIYEGEY